MGGYICIYIYISISLAILGWPKSSFVFSHNIFWKTTNELFGQPNIYIKKLLDVLKYSALGLMNTIYLWYLSRACNKCFDYFSTISVSGTDASSDFCTMLRSAFIRLSFTRLYMSKCYREMEKNHPISSVATKEGSSHKGLGLELGLEG